MPKEWRRSILVPVYKNKGDAQSCNNYQGDGICNEVMEKSGEQRLRRMVKIGEEQFGFMPGKSTRGLRVSRSKTEGMTLNKQGNHPELMLQRVRVLEVREFKYLGSTFQENGECEREVTRRIQAGCAGWKKVSGVLCDKNISLKVKGKVHKIVIWLAMIYGIKTVGATSLQMEKLGVAEMRMLRMEMEIAKMDKVRNECVRRKVGVENIEEKIREARLRWYGHMRRREDSYVGRKVLYMEVSGKRPKGD